jgi:hypothetical protein
VGRSPTWLLDHRRNEHSQSGEDGIIEKALEVIASSDRWCVEFGAWDGMFLTNTRHLIQVKGYSAILIEANKKRFLDLRRNYAANARVRTINRLVGLERHDGLDAILSTTPIPTAFDLLSIDVDGNDYHIWKIVSAYRPKIVVIEFNPTIPNHIRFVQLADKHTNQGASLLSLVELGREKGYELVCALPFNAVFVAQEYFPSFEIEDNSLGALRPNADGITYLFTGYDGTVFLSGYARLPWHEIPLNAARMQPLPRFLRKYPESYSRAERLAFALYRAVRGSEKWSAGLKGVLRRFVGKLSRRAT